MLLSSTEALTYPEAQMASALRASSVQFAPQNRQQDFTRHDVKHANLGAVWMFAALCTMLIVLTALGIYGQRAAHQKTADTSWVLYTHKLLSQITALRATMTDVQASQHSYTLNGEQTFIDAFHDAVGRLGAQYHALRLLVQAQPEHQRSVDGLAPLLTARIAYAINEFETRLPQARGAPQVLSVRSEEKELDNNLRIALDQIKEAEEALVLVHQQTAERNAQSAVMMSVFSFIGAVGIAAIALCALYFQMRERRIKEPQALRSNEDYATSKHKHAALLHDSERRLQAVISGSRVGVWDWNLDTNEVHFSKEWKDQLGYADNEIRDQFDEWQKRVHPDDIEPTLAIVHRFIKSPWPNYETEFRMRHKNGSWRWILARASLQSDNYDGGSVHMVGVHIDITERRHVEEALCTSQAQLVALVNDSTSKSRSSER